MALRRDHPTTAAHGTGSRVARDGRAASSAGVKGWRPGVATSQVAMKGSEVQPQLMVSLAGASGSRRVTTIRQNHLALQEKPCGALHATGRERGDAAAARREAFQAGRMVPPG